MWFVHVHDDYILHFPFIYWSHAYQGEKNAMDYSAPVCENHVKTLIDDTAPRNKPQWHRQHSYEVTNNHNLWIEKEALKNDCWQTQWKRFMDCLHQECPILVKWMAYLIHYATVTWKLYSALFLFFFFLVPFPLSEYQRLPSRENKHDLCSHGTCSDFSPSFT